MTLTDILHARRTIRLFQQRPVSRTDLTALLEAARVTSCAGNQQRLRYTVVTEPALAERLFAFTAYGALVRPRRSPVWGVSAPTAFIVVTTAPSPATTLAYADAGAAIQSMQLTATERGLGCCWLGAIRRADIHALLQLPADADVLFVLAVGHPAEHPVLEDTDDPEAVQYYLDDHDTLHVPKLTLRQLVDWR